MSVLWLAGMFLAVAEPPPAALRLQESGDHEAAAGRWDIASRYYEQAHRAAPGWSQPILSLGRAALHQGALDSAGTWFARLEAPAGDGSRVAPALRDCIGREQRSTVPSDTCEVYLDALLGPVEARRAALQQVVIAAPFLAPAWADLVPLLDDPQERRDAISHGLGADPDPTTWRVLLVHQQALTLGGL